MKEQPNVHVTLKECDYCKEMLRIVETEHSKAMIEVASQRQHVCWQNLPDDANLLVLED